VATIKPLSRPVSTAADQPQAVVQGYSPDITYSLLEQGGLAVAAGALFVASNADLTLPTSHGIQPGNGSFIQVIATATGSTVWHALGLVILILCTGVIAPLSLLGGTINQGPGKVVHEV